MRDRLEYVFELSRTASRIEQMRATVPGATLGDPRAIGAPLHAGHDLWRCRVGDYRIVARIHDDVLQVLVVRIRRHAYWRLLRT